MNFLSRYYKSSNHRLADLSARLAEKFSINTCLGYPYIITIENTAHCNYRCPLCQLTTGEFTRPRGQMALDVFEKIVAEIAPFVQVVQLPWYGEPLVHKDIYKMIRCLSEHGIVSSLSTNGYFIKDNEQKILDSGLSEIIVALDGISKETYEKYRQGGDFDRVFDGIKNLAQLKRTTGSPLALRLQFIVMQHNEHQLEEVKGFADSINADDLIFKSVAVSEERAREFLPQGDEYKRYVKREDGTLETKQKKKGACARLYNSALITWDGEVAVCCYDFNVNYSMGNVFKEGFRKIWKSKKYKTFRRTIMRNREKIDMCAHCEAFF